MRCPAHLANLGDSGADQHTGIGDQHDLVVGVDQRRRHHLAVASALLNRNHAFRTTTVARVLFDRCAFAKTIFSRREYAGWLVGLIFRCHIGGGREHRDHALAFFKHHAAHTAGITAHAAHIVFIKAHGLATVREQHHIVLAFGQRGANQEVVVVQVNGNDAGLTGVGEVRERGLFHRAHAGRHEDKVIFGEGTVLAGQWQHDVDLLTLLQREHVHDGATA